MAGALAAMKRKKALEIQVQHLQNNIDRVNEQMTTLEGTGMTATVLDSLSYASKASKETMQSLNVTDVDRVLESINDQNQQMQEIHEAMAQPLGAAADIDDEELLNELEVRVCRGLGCVRYQLWSGFTTYRGCAIYMGVPVKCIGTPALQTS